MLRQLTLYPLREFRVSFNFALPAAFLLQFSVHLPQLLSYSELVTLELLSFICLFIDFKEVPISIFCWSSLLIHLCWMRSGVTSSLCYWSVFVLSLSLAKHAWQGVWNWLIQRAFRQTWLTVLTPWHIWEENHNIYKSDFWNRIMNRSKLSLVLSLLMFLSKFSA